MNSTSFLPFNLNLDAQRLDISTAIADNQLAAGTTAAIAAGLLWYLLSSDKDSIKQARGWPLIGQWAFFTRRHDFVQEGFERFSGDNSFGFNILKHQVVALRGEEARKVFFDRRDLSFTEGYKLLFGGGPNVKDVVQEENDKNDQEQMSFFIRRLSPLLKMDRLAERKYF